MELIGFHRTSKRSNDLSWRPLPTPQFQCCCRKLIANLRKYILSIKFTGIRDLKFKIKIRRRNSQTLLDLFLLREGRNYSFLWFPIEIKAYLLYIYMVFNPQSIPVFKSHFCFIIKWKQIKTLVFLQSMAQLHPENSQALPLCSVFTHTYFMYSIGIIDPLTYSIFLFSFSK